MDIFSSPIDTYQQQNALTAPLPAPAQLKKEGVELQLEDDLFFALGREGVRLTPEGGKITTFLNNLRDKIREKNYQENIEEEVDTNSGIFQIILNSDYIEDRNSLGETIQVTFIEIDRLLKQEITAKIREESENRQVNDLAILDFDANANESREQKKVKHNTRYF